MSAASQGDVTRLLARWNDGDRDALNEATGIVYGELRKIADAYLHRERGGHTLQPTALINEAYLALIRHERCTFENRRKFFAFAAHLMRRILVDHARAAGAGKRGGGLSRVPLHKADSLTFNHAADFVALNEAIERLARLSPRKAQVIELRHFGGLSLEETAETIGVSIATVSREQRMAEAWLNQAMSQPDE